MSVICVTEALSKLKVLNSRIEKETTSTKFVVQIQSGKVPLGYKSIEDFISSAKASYQSILALIEERDKIKSAIVISNATTKVSIAGTEYTVAGAIERKTSIRYKQELVRHLIGQHTTVIRSLESNNREVQMRLDSLLQTTFGKDIKSNPEDVKSITESFLSKNELKLIDPLEVEKLSKDLNQEIENFLGSVDTSLSISNATTFINL